MEIILNKFYFLKGFEDIIVFFLFTLDILLFTRIPNLFKRGRPFLKRYTRNFMLNSFTTITSFNSTLIYIITFYAFIV